MTHYIVLTLSVLACAEAARGQMFFGTGTPTPVDYFGAYDNSVNFRIGAYGQGYNPGGSFTGTQAFTITGPTGFASQAVDYPSGQYTLFFNAPNPAAVGVTVGGDMSGLGNVQISGTGYSATLTLVHDNGNVTAGLGEIDINTTAINPVTGFKVVAPGGLANPGASTVQTANILNHFQGFMYNKENNSEANLNAVTAADLIPSGQNLSNVGSSYTDLVARANANANTKTILISVPMNAQASYLDGVGAALAKLRPGIQAYVQDGGEDWNALFPTYNAFVQRANADMTHSFANSDDFQRAAEEYGISSVLMMQEIQKNAPNAKGFINSQGANTAWAQQAINAEIRNFGSTTFHQTIGALGPSYYPGDAIQWNPGTVDNLISETEADLSRQNGYLAAHVAIARANGLSTIVYEASIMGALTSSGAPASLFNQFINDPRAGQLTTKMLTDMKGILNQTGDGVYWFTEPGGLDDLWGGQGNPLDPPTQVTRAVIAFADSLDVPEPVSGLFFVSIFAFSSRHRPNRPGS